MFKCAKIVVKSIDSVSNLWYNILRSLRSSDGLSVRPFLNNSSITNAPLKPSLTRLFLWGVG